MPLIETTVRATTNEFAELIAAIGPGDITEDARSAARLCILDLIGCAVAGHAAPPAEATRRWVAASQPAGTASIWLTGETSSTLGAAMANAAAGCALDGDDLHWEAVLHAGAALVPASIAAAEEIGASGRQLIDALVIGYEVACRIGASVDWDALGQMATGSWIGWGTAAILANLRGGTSDDYAKAFGVVGALRPVVLPPGVTINRNGIKEGISWGTYVGLASQQLAAAGLTGPEECLDNKLLNRARILAAGNGRFEIEASEFKPYVCCAWTHAAVDALLGLMADHALSPDEITRAHVTLYTAPVEMLDNRPDPPTIQAAQYSVPFVLALAAIEGKAGLLPLSEDALGRSDIVGFATQFSLEASSAYDAALPAKRPVTVSLETARGTVARELDRESNPSNLESVAAKFRLLTRHVPPNSGSSHATCRQIPAPHTPRAHARAPVGHHHGSRLAGRGHQTTDHAPAR